MILKVIVRKDFVNAQVARCGGGFGHSVKRQQRRPASRRIVDRSA
jgi:hypothetical protein